MTSDLFPPFVRVERMAIAAVDGVDLAAAIAVPESIARAAPRRQQQFITGRVCAQLAIRSLLGGSAAPSIGIGGGGAPAWPAGVVGSISHTSTLACAAVARAADARSLGLDIEDRVAVETATNIADQVTLAGELDALAPMIPDRDVGWILTTVFSAKECLFKCLYPHVGRYFDFRDARVTAIDPGGTFSVRLVESLSAEFAAGYTLNGRFELDDETVTTALVLGAPSS